MMSDEDIDIESDEHSTHSRVSSEYYDDVKKQNNGQPGNQVNKSKRQAEKRAHHNALERKRRDHIKDSFSCLRDAVPSLHGEKASRAQILKKAADYIQFMRRKNCSHQQDIDDLKRQNSLLETQIRTLEKARATGNFTLDASDGDMYMGTMNGAESLNGTGDVYDEDDDLLSESEEESSDDEVATSMGPRNKSGGNGAAKRFKVFNSR